MNKKHLTNISGWKLSILSLVIFFGAFEIILRVFSFSYRPAVTGFELAQEYRIFLKEENHFKTNPLKKGVFQQQAFPVEKPEDEVRIVFMGGSSVLHLKDFAYLKEKISRDLQPGRDLRIINAGGLSYGTNRLLLHFEEILEYKPDIVVLYSGHNEFLETFMKENFYKQSLLTNMNNWLVENSRFYQLISYLVYELEKQSLESQYGHMNKKKPFFQPDVRISENRVFSEAEKKLIYSNYEKNIRKMAAIAAKNDILLIISTVAYNRMVPPRIAADSSYYECIKLYEDWKWEEALECFEQALEKSKQPFRATETTNAIIREIAAEENIPLVDLDSMIKDNAKNGIPGFGLFNDNCHLNERGNQLLLDAVYRKLKESGALSEVTESRF